MWATVLAFFNFFPALVKLIDMVSSLFKKSVAQEIQDEKERLRKEVENSDETGRP